MSTDPLPVINRHREAPDEVSAAEEKEYRDYRETTDLREPYRIPPIFLKNTKKFKAPHLITSETPLLVFINAKSGGHVGPHLAGILSRALGTAQVFDVSKDRPGPVLATLWQNLKSSQDEGDERASVILENLRIVVAGGDGTATWVLGEIAKLKLDPEPPLAVMPLGTGNDLSVSFGWGKAFQWSWVRTIAQQYRTLKRYHEAEVKSLDRWHLSIESSSSSPDVFEDTPHSLLPLPETPKKVQGHFWNYFSIGLDAEAAHSFHELRESRPWLASGRLMNQAWYGWFSCTSGWFCGAPSLTPQVKLRVRGGPAGNAWREIPIPSSIRAIVFLNLQTYGGGRDIWGLADKTNLTRKGLKEPIFNDGAIEIVGLHSGWHTAVVMGQLNARIHAKRLAQCSEVDMDLAAAQYDGDVKGMESRRRRKSHKTYMQIDGEPWEQEIPVVNGGGGEEVGVKRGVVVVDVNGESDDHGEEEESVAPLKVRISLEGQSKVLMNLKDIQGNKKVRSLIRRNSILSRLNPSSILGGGLI
jgi:diacylglycerol kinase (ATP)